MEFGNGITKEMGRILTERGHKKILAVYDKGIKAAALRGLFWTPSKRPASR
jgi:hypothetical protein